jgi:hypothetical protein
MTQVITRTMTTIKQGGNKMKKLVTLTVAVLFCVALFSLTLSAGQHPPTKFDGGEWDEDFGLARNAEAGYRPAASPDCGCTKEYSATPFPGLRDDVLDEPLLMNVHRRGGFWDCGWWTHWEPNLWGPGGHWVTEWECVWVPPPFMPK